MAIPVGREEARKASYLLSKLTATVVLSANVSCTEADDSSLISCQAHPTDDTRFRRTDGLLAVINAVNISFVQPLQVCPETNRTMIKNLWIKKPSI